MRFVRNYIILNFFIWSGVALIDLAGDYFNSIIWEREFDWPDEIPFVTSWYTWALITPLAVYFSKKQFYSKNRLPQFVVYHFGIYLMLNCIQVLLASFYIQLLNQWLTDAQPLTGILYKTAMSGTFYNFLIYSIILLAINTYRYYRDLQLEQTRSVQLQQKLTESRMQFLKQQLQPHFLFNTHHSIITLMKLGEKQKAIEMMEKLSELMRFALRENQAQEITLQEEIHLIDLYLAIQKIRFEEKLVVIVDVEDTVKKALLPAMIMQPLAENSIKYAVEPATEQCTITVSVKKQDQHLQIMIQDNGHLHQESYIEKGIGLKNTEERLKQLYGENHSMKISRENGFYVTIQIPLHYA